MNLTIQYNELIELIKSNDKLAEKIKDQADKEKVLRNYINLFLYLVIAKKDLPDNQIITVFELIKSLNQKQFVKPEMIEEIKGIVLLIHQKPELAYKGLRELSEKFFDQKEYDRIAFNRIIALYTLNEKAENLLIEEMNEIKNMTKDTIIDQCAEYNLQQLLKEEEG